MDPRRMDVEGGRVIHRERRTRRLAVVVAVQNLLVVACLLATLYVYWSKEKQQPAEDVYVQFDPSPGHSGNATQTFTRIFSINKMGLSNEKNKIQVECSGPYILYMDACYESLNAKNASGILQLQEEGTKTPISSFKLQASSKVCRGLHSIVYLRAQKEASLHQYADNEFRIINVTVGLSSLLGRRCYF